MDIILLVFKRFPAFGFLVCLSLFTFITAPKTFQGLQDNEFLPGGRIHRVEFLGERVEEVARRHASRDCYVIVEIANQKREARSDCKETEELSMYDKITVVDSSGYLSSQSFTRGHLVIDLFLVVLELFGMFKFARAFLGRFKLPQSHTLINMPTTLFK